MEYELCHLQFLVDTSIVYSQWNMFSRNANGMIAGYITPATQRDNWKSLSEMKVSQLEKSSINGEYMHDPFEVESWEAPEYWD